MQSVMAPLPFWSLPWIKFLASTQDDATTTGVIVFDIVSTNGRRSRLGEGCAGLCQEQIRPAARDAEKAFGVPPELFAKAAELGFLVLELPESLGGLDLPQRLAGPDMGGTGPWRFSASCRAGLGSATPPQCCVLSQISHQTFGRDSRTSKRTGADRPRPLLDVSQPHLAWDGVPRLERAGSGERLRGTSRPVRMARDAEYLLISARDEEGVAVVLWLEQKRSPWTVEEGDVRLGLLAAGLRRLRFDGLEVGSDDVIARGEEAESLLARSLPRL